MRKWFKEVEEYVDKNFLRNVFKNCKRIFNLNETALYLNPKGDKVIALRDDKTVYKVTSNDEKKDVTILINVNAAGDIAPPMVVFHYVQVPPEDSASVPEDWYIGRSRNGWIIRNTSFEYFANSFILWVNEPNIERPIILFLDGHTSHDTLHLLKIVF